MASNQEEPNDHQKPRKPDDDPDIEDVEAEDVDGNDAGDPFQSFNRGRNLQFRLSGCLGSLIALVIAAVLFFVFLPLGIALLIGVMGYYSWKMRRR